VTADRGPSLMSVLLGKGDGTLAEAVNYAASVAQLALSDLDGDGLADVVGVNAHSVQVLQSSCR